MKAVNFTYARIGILCLITFLSISVVFGQAPKFSFQNPTLISGTDKQVNAVYRFPSVITGVDALVTIQGITGNISLRNIDRTADGYGEAFQPEYKIGGLSNAYIDFLITFVQAGTNTSLNQPLVDVTGLDIDGDTQSGLMLMEFNRVDMGNGVCDFNFNNTQLVISQTGTAFTGANITGVLFGALVDTSAKEVMFTVSSSNVTSFTYRVGANNLTTNAGTRYASLYFKKFTYDYDILPVSPVKSFNGSNTTDKVKLNWSLSSGNSLTSVELEKSNSAGKFQPIAEYMVNVDGNMENNFSYSDNQAQGDVFLYRLKMTNAFGKIEYSNVLSFKMKGPIKNDMKVFPTIVSSSITVNITAEAQENSVMRVTDMWGRTVKEQKITLQEGNNSLIAAGFEQFQKGNYVVSIHTSGGITSKQIIIQ
jgi:hypothetical protein